ncbi:hypothetical protein PGTUg99_006748 [Puccinia graminis f. sp. tritici]|uniref:RING-type domain-containing protein n=1 Tax=Puccinia graminis f. sp. tritici TaxID=56615 RepID=A0A5B0SHH8_PUCGR|nr:hypothetical protein PGTUg99_006748 [Puccinia graminis f. sp. tritici]
MDARVLLDTETALLHLTPEDQLLFRNLFETFQELHFELHNNPLRGRLTDEEFAHYSRYHTQAEQAMGRMGDADFLRLNLLWSHWTNVIGRLELARDISFNRRKARVTSQLDILSRRTAADETSIPDGASECVVCMEELVRSEQTIVQLPCSHFFHRDCIQRWLEDHLGCPVCRVEVELPPQQHPR